MAATKLFEFLLKRARKPPKNPNYDQAYYSILVGRFRERHIKFWRPPRRARHSVPIGTPSAQYRPSIAEPGHLAPPRRVHIFYAALVHGPYTLYDFLHA